VGVIVFPAGVIGCVRRKSNSKDKTERSGIHRTGHAPDSHKRFSGKALRRACPVRTFQKTGQERTPPERIFPGGPAADAPRGLGGPRPAESGSCDAPGTLLK